MFLPGKSPGQRSLVGCSPWNHKELDTTEQFHFWQHSLCSQWCLQLCLLYVLCLLTQSCPTLCNPIYCSPPHSSVHRDSPGKNTGVGCHVLLQGIFLTQGSNPGLPHCRQILYHLIYQWSPRILEWVAYPFSSRSSCPGNWTGVSCIAGGFFISWAIRETRSRLREIQTLSGKSLSPLVGWR